MHTAHARSRDEGNRLGSAGRAVAGGGRAHALDVGYWSNDWSNDCSNDGSNHWAGAHFLDVGDGAGGDVEGELGGEGGQRVGHGAQAVGEPHVERPPHVPRPRVQLAPGGQTGQTL